MSTRFDHGRWRRGTAVTAALCLLAPVTALPAQAQIFGQRNPNAGAGQRQGMSTRKKVAVLAGSALLYYLYKKHTAAKAEQAGGGAGVGQAGTTTNARRPQLYRSKNGGVYYRDPQGRPVWLTVPNRPVQVPVEEVQRYAPDYRRYRGPAPAAPRGYRTESFSEFSPDLVSAYRMNESGSGGGGQRTGMPPGPRGPGGGY